MQPAAIMRLAHLNTQVLRGTQQIESGDLENGLQNLRDLEKKADDLLEKFGKDKNPVHFFFGIFKTIFLSP